MSSAFIACKLISRDKRKTPLHQQAHLKLLCFSFLYTINIGISNASLGLVTVPVHQAIRATSPALTVLLANALPTHLSMRFSWTTYLTLLPIVAGVILATYGGRYDASLWGLLLTVIGAFLAVTKTIATNILLRNTELSMHPIELLSILSPYAAAQALLWAIWNGELSRIMKIAPESRWLAILVLVNTAMAAALNIVSFEANRRSGPLAMAITANLKQVILLAVPLEGELPGVAVILGTSLTAASSVWHVRVRSQDKESQQSTAVGLLPNRPSDRT
jgi:drug/metabolite transporter (DMT)-like permease